MISSQLPDKNTVSVKNCPNVKSLPEIQECSNDISINFTDDNKCQDNSSSQLLISNNLQTTSKKVSNVKIVKTKKTSYSKYKNSKSRSFDYRETPIDANKQSMIKHIFNNKSSKVSLLSSITNSVERTENLNTTSKSIMFE